MSRQKSVEMVENTPDEIVKETVDYPEPVMGRGNREVMWGLFKTNAQMRETVFEALADSVEEYPQMLKILGAYQLTRKQEPEKYTGPFAILKYENEHLTQLVDGLDSSKTFVKQLLKCETAEDVLTAIKPFSRHKDK